ncbi:MAG TPA: HAD-IA family hydrolase [Anaerovoracaceae bacterium]|nr:HAD-IA family hydrolase [Anaerovoracaceae bacterium]
MKKAVIFDFDGTILDTNGLILNSWQHTFLHFEGEKRNETEIYKTFGETLELSMKNLLPEVDTKKAIEKYREYQISNSEKEIRLFNGIIELIKELKSKGYKLSIVTSRLKNTTLKYLEHFDLFKYFDEIVTCDDTDVHKPEAEPAMIALRKMGVMNYETIMIGDTKFDIGCANNAGIDSVLVGWGIAYNNDEGREIYKPKYIINEPMELLGVI